MRCRRPSSSRFVHWGPGLCLAIAITVGVVLGQPSYAAFQVSSWQPPVRVVNWLNGAWIDFNRWWSSYQVKGFDDKLSLILMEEDLPYLDRNVVKTLCQDFMNFQQRNWHQLNVEQKLDCAQAILWRLKLVLSNDSLEFLGYYNGKFVYDLKAQIAEAEHHRDIYALANQRVLVGFPEFSGKDNLMAVAPSAFEQVFTAALTDILYGRQPAES